MKNNLLKIYTATFYFCSTFVMNAQQPGADDSGGILEGTSGDTTPAAPIDDSIWILMLIGLTFIILKIRASYRQELRS